jgi:Rieske Fe-S protein
MTDIDKGRAIAQQVLASRRGIMCGVAALGAAGVLAACGTAEPEDGPTADPTNDAGADNGGGDTGSGDVVATTDQVPVGGGIVAAGLVITQPSADEFLAFSASCPHQGTAVNPPDDSGVIECPNHGSQFDVEGGLLRGPAETGLEPVEVEVQDGEIVRL